MSGHGQTSSGVTGTSCRHRLIATAVLPLIIAVAGTVRADNWPGWRGPRITGISAEGGWNAKKPKKLWEFQVGTGHSSVAVGQDRLYTLGKDYPPAYSTPMPFDHNGKPSLAVFNAVGLIVLDRTSGLELAKFGWKTEYGANIATAIIAGNTAFISSGYNRGCALVGLGRGGLDKIWESRTMRNHMASCILWNGQLYGFDESKLKCVDLETGRQRWEQGRLGKGALMLGDGKLIVLSERGQLVIAEASPSGFEPISTTPAVSGRCWVVPVLANGRIFCRSNEGHLVCMDVRR